MLKEIRFLVFILNYRIAAFFSSKMCAAGFKIIRPDIKKSRSSSGRIWKKSRSFGRISGAFLVQCFGYGWFCPDPDQTFFPESGSGSVKESGSDPENPDSDPQKTPKNCKDNKQNFIPYFSQSFLVRFLQNLIKEHHLDPISLLTDGSGSGFLKYGSGSAKNRIHPDPDLDPKHWF